MYVLNLGVKGLNWFPTFIAMLELNTRSGFFSVWTYAVCCLRTDRGEELANTELVRSGLRTAALWTACFSRFSVPGAFRRHVHCFEPAAQIRRHPSAQVQPVPIFVPVEAAPSSAPACYSSCGQSVSFYQLLTGVFSFVTLCVVYTQLIPGTTLGVGGRSLCLHRLSSRARNTMPQTQGYRNTKYDSL